MRYLDPNTSILVRILLAVLRLLLLLLIPLVIATRRPPRPNTSIPILLLPGGPPRHTSASTHTTSSAAAATHTATATRRPPRPNTSILLLMSLLLLPGVLLDRAFETDARVHGASVTWDAATPNALSYERTAGYATQGSNPGLADPRQVCYSHVRASPWTGGAAPLPSCRWCSARWRRRARRGGDQETWRVVRGPNYPYPPAESKRGSPT